MRATRMAEGLEEVVREVKTGGKRRWKDPSMWRSGGTKPTATSDTENGNHRWTESTTEKFLFIFGYFLLN